MTVELRGYGVSVLDRLTGRELDLTPYTGREGKESPTGNMVQPILTLRDRSVGRHREDEDQ